MIDTFLFIAQHISFPYAFVKLPGFLVHAMQAVDISKPMLRDSFPDLCIYFTVESECMQ